MTIFLSIRNNPYTCKSLQNILLIFYEFFMNKKSENFSVFFNHHPELLMIFHRFYRDKLIFS